MRIAGIAVQMTSSRVLPWIGGPSRFSSPGRIRNSMTEKHDDHRDEHEDRHRGDDRGRPRGCRSCRPASSRQRGNQWMLRPMAMPIAEAMTPTMTICWTVRLRSRRGVLSSGMPGGILWVVRDRAQRGTVTRRRDGAIGGGLRRAGRAMRAAVAEALEAAGASGRPTARRRGGGGTPWRTAPAGGSRRAGRPRARSGRGVREHARRRAPCAPRSGARGTSCRRSRRTRAAAGGATRRRGGRCRRGLRSEAYSASTIAVASSKRLVRWRMVAGRCMVAEPLVTCRTRRGMTVTRLARPQFGAWALDTVSGAGRLSQSLQATPEEAANEHAGT